MERSATESANETAQRQSLLRSVTANDRNSGCPVSSFCHKSARCPKWALTRVHLTQKAQSGSSSASTSRPSRPVATEEMDFPSSSFLTLWWSLALLVLSLFSGGSQGYQINCTNLFFSCGDNAGTPNSICRDLGFVPAPTETYNPRGKRSVDIENFSNYGNSKHLSIWPRRQQEQKGDLLLDLQEPHLSRAKRGVRRISFFDECCDNKCGIKTFRLYCENDPDWVMSSTSTTTPSIYTCDD